MSIGTLDLKTPTVFQRFRAYAVCLGLLAIPSSFEDGAAAAELWLAPSDNVSQPTFSGFTDLLRDQGEWPVAASRGKVFSVTISYLERTPPAASKNLLRRIASLGMRLNVGIPALEVDKSKCGDGIEGIVWPGEVALAVAALQSLRADVDSFGLDLPLTSGTINSAKKSCHFSIYETALRLAQTVNILLRAYPSAKIIDTEVPTGMPAETWAFVLRQWLADYRAATGREFDGLSMDVWFRGQWADSVKQTASVAAARKIPIGITVGASAGSEVTPHEWITEAKSNQCAVEKLVEPDFIVIADWLNPRVRNLPESDPDTLMGLAAWASSPTRCTSAN